MTFRVKRLAMALYETPDGDLPSPRGGLMQGDLLDKMGDAGLAGWIEVVVVGTDPRRVGFVPVDALEPVPEPGEAIDGDWFFNTLSLAARIFGSNHLYLYALAHAASRVRNVRGTGGFGPFQYGESQWSDLVGRLGAAAGVGIADRTDPYSQAVLAAAAAADSATSLTAALGRPSHAADPLLRPRARAGIYRCSAQARGCRGPGQCRPDRRPPQATSGIVRWPHTASNGDGAARRGGYSAATRHQGSCGFLAAPRSAWHPCE